MKSESKNKSTHHKEPSDLNVLAPRGMGRHFAESSWRVALPFIVLGLPAGMLDKKLGTDGLFLFISMIISAVVSLIIVYRYAKKYFPDQNKLNNPQEGKK